MSAAEQHVHVTVFDPRVTDVHTPQSTGTRTVNLNNGAHYNNSLSLLFADDDAAIAFAESIIATVRQAQRDEAITTRLEYLRSQIRTECISQSEIAELQSLAEHIAPGDVQLAEWAGIPEDEFMQR